jgi:hypothetical protein
MDIKDFGLTPDQVKKFREVLAEVEKDAAQRAQASVSNAQWIPSSPCPGCGRCNTCGRGGYQQVYPVYPQVTPWYPVYPTWTTGTVSTTSTINRPATLGTIFTKTT